MFLVNSRTGHFTAAYFRSTYEMLHLLKAPLLPKLRGHFAEFLSESSLERLRILSSPTCVGLRYGHHYASTRGSFLGKQLGQFVSLRTPSRTFRVMVSRICLRYPLSGLAQHFHPLVGPNACVSPSFNLIMVVQEYYACYPSPTLFSLGLGSD